MDVKWKWISLLAVLLLICDFYFTFEQYHHTKMDGDFKGIVIPAEACVPVLSDPVGLNVLANQEKVHAAGRFLCHWMEKNWSDTVILMLQRCGVQPVDSLYLSSGLFAFLMHIFLLFMLLKFLNVDCRNVFLLMPVVVLLNSLFFYGDYYVTFGLIDHAITYVFFYAFPIALLLLGVYPFYKKLVDPFYSIHFVQYLVSYLLILPLAFSGPLVKPMIFIFVLLLGIFLFEKLWKVGWRTWIQNYGYIICFAAILTIVSVYGYYISTFNAESADPLPLSDRYVALFYGIQRYVKASNSFWLLMIFIAINSFLIFVADLLFFKKYIRIICWVFSFSVLYLLLLPLGGYRAYRPDIVRYDTFMPVTLAVYFLLIKGCIFLYKNYHVKRNLFYAMALLVVALFFMKKDIAFKMEYKCEREHLDRIYNAMDTTIILKTNCNVLCWENQELIKETIQKEINVILNRYHIKKDYQTIQYVE